MATQAESSNTRIKNDAPEPSKGTSVLPVARVAKIVKSDKDIAMCSKEALFLMSVATVSMHCLCYIPLSTAELADLAVYRRNS